MNFFQGQLLAKKKTKQLIVFYILTVLITAISTTVFVGLLFNYEKIQMQEFRQIDLNQPYVYYTFGFVCVMILLGSFIKILLLGKGGKYVAKIAGAREVDLETTDPDLRRYINVVEEMSIASGTPTPAIYIMENEDAINAFAAGYEINDAVIAVTRGCILKLNRDELQAVVAHEFSHILNGDMKLNIKLIGYLFGLSMIGELGRVLLRSNSGHRYRSRDSKNSGGQIALVGLGIMIIGYVGMFFASIIQASISRQREFLADASSVQFTRNPDGIGGALKKIFIDSQGSLLTSSRAGEIGHFFFSDAIKRFSNIFATHPPIQERLKAVYGKFDFNEFSKDEIQKLHHDMQQRSEDFANTPTESNKVQVGINNFSSPESVEQFIESSGEVSVAQIENAHYLMGHIPQFIKDKSKEVIGAKSLVYSLLLDDQINIRESQLSIIKKKELPLCIELLGEFYSSYKKLGIDYRMALLQLAVGRLKKIEEHQKELFLSICHQLIMVDNKININEFIIYNFLESSFKDSRKFFQRIIGSRLLLNDVHNIFSFMAHVGHKDDVIKHDCFQMAIGKVYTKKLIIKSLKELSLNQISKSILRIKQSDSNFKNNFLYACVDLIKHDGEISVKEFEVLQLISLMIGVPMPAILPTTAATATTTTA